MPDLSTRFSRGLELVSWSRSTTRHVPVNYDRGKKRTSDGSSVSDAQACAYRHSQRSWSLLALSGRTAGRYHGPFGVRADIEHSAKSVAFDPRDTSALNCCCAKITPEPISRPQILDVIIVLHSSRRRGSRRASGVSENFAGVDLNRAHSSGAYYESTLFWLDPRIVAFEFQDAGHVAIRCIRWTFYHCKLPWHQRMYAVLANDEANAQYFHSNLGYQCTLANLVSPLGTIPRF